MKASILACGLVNEVGIFGTRGTHATWEALEMSPPGTGKTVKALFGKADPTFRRIDMLARGLVLACEAADLESVLTSEQRMETCVCVETRTGALATDINFAASLEDECVHAGIFPYSLTSTSLGEVALRYKLHGATISMSVQEDDAGESLRESLRMLNCGECQYAVAGVADTLSEPTAGEAPVMRTVVAVLSAYDPNSQLGTLTWPDRLDTERDPFQQFAAMCS